MKIGFALVLCLVTNGCASRIIQSTVVFDYVDFGPQAMAYQILGPKNLQWEPDTPIMIGQGRVRVVVYRGVPEEAVKEHYPQDRTRYIDYRYIQYGEALNYLDAKIEKNLLRRITERLRQTREIILNTLG